MSDPIAGLNLLAAGWANVIGRACWQGGLALLLVGAFCRLMPRLPGRIQCWLWRLAYLKLCVGLLWVAPVELPVLAPRPAVASRESSVVSHQSSVASRQLWDRRGIGRSAGAEINGVMPHNSRLASDDCRLTTGLLLLWLVGVGWCGAQVLGDWRRTQRLRTQGEPVRDEGLIGECRALCWQLGIRREPALRIADSLGCPVLAGITRPAVILPASFLARFTRAHLRLMLAHELAHLQRRDLVWAWLPSLGRVLFFFHPLIWLAEGEWRMAHEMACDEQVVLRAGASQAGYGGMLLAVMEQSLPAVSAGLLTVGVAESYATVRRRLVAIRQIRAVSRSHWALAALLLAAAGIGGVIPWRLTPAPARRHRPIGTVARVRTAGGQEIASRAGQPAWVVSIEERRVSPSGPGAAHETQARAWRPGIMESGSKLRPLQRTRVRDASLKSRRTRKRVDGAALYHSLEAEARSPRSDATLGSPGAIRFRQAGPDTARQARIAAELASLPVDPDPASASRPGSFDPPYAAGHMPDTRHSPVFPVEKQRAALDPAGRDLEQAAFNKGMMEKKRWRATAMLFVPKAVVIRSALFGWEPSSLFHSPKLPSVQLAGPLDPGKLKEVVAQACRQGIIDPEGARRIFAKAAQEGGLDPRALKKMLAQAHQEAVGDGSLREAKGMLPLGKVLRLDQAMDRQKRELEKQTGGEAGSGKPFFGTDPGF